MTVYADVLICVNFIIDYFLLGLCAKVLKSPCSFRRQLLGAAVGSLCSLCILLPTVNIIVTLIIQFLTSAAVVFAAYGKTAISIFIRRLGCFYITSFIFSGAMAVVARLISPQGLMVRNGVIYYGLSATLLVLLSVASYVIITLICRFSKRGSAPTCKLSILQDDVQLTVTALVDSGNRLREPFSEKWVMLLDSGYEESFSNVSAPRRVIPYSTVAGGGVLYGFCPEKIQLENGERLDMYVAFSPRPLECGYGAVISAEAL